jgi:hypothetical protein
MKVMPAWLTIKYHLFKHARPPSSLLPIITIAITATIIIHRVILLDVWDVSQVLSFLVPYAYFDDFPHKHARYR